MPQLQGGYLESGVTLYVSQAPEAPKTLKTSPGKLYGFIVVNLKATIVYLYIFDSVTAAGDLLFPPIGIPPSGGSASMLLDEMIPFKTGLTMGSSSTLATYTSTATADLAIRAHLK